MSKLVEGHIECPDLDVVRHAAELLGWTVEENTRVQFFDGPGELCEVTVRPQGELDRHGRDVGRKYTIGFKQTADGIKVLHDNAMNGAEVYSAESKQLDDTTQRVIGKMKTSINIATTQRHLTQRRESWRMVQEGDVQVMVIRRR